MFSNVESNFAAQLFRQQFQRFGDECQLPSRFKVKPSVQNVHQLQQHMTKWRSLFRSDRIALSM